MGLALSVNVQLTPITCCTCGAAYALGNETELRRTHAFFWCPNGHQQRFTGESDADKAARLARELDAERARHKMTRNMLDHETRARARAQKSKARIQQRIKGGVCPCCNRTFVALGRHMASKHPDYAEPQKPSEPKP